MRSANIFFKNIGFGVRIKTIPIKHYIFKLRLFKFKSPHREMLNCWFQVDTWHWIGDTVMLLACP